MSSFNSDILDKGVTKGVVGVVVEAEDNIDFHDDDSIPERRQIGLFSAVFIIFNRIIDSLVLGELGLAFSKPYAVLIFVFKRIRHTEFYLRSQWKCRAFIVSCLLGFIDTFLILEIDLCGLLAPSSQRRVCKCILSGDRCVLLILL